MYEQNEEVRIGKPEELIELQNKQMAAAAKALKLKKQQQKKAAAAARKRAMELSNQGKGHVTMGGEFSDQDEMNSQLEGSSHHSQNPSDANMNASTMTADEPMEQQKQQKNTYTKGKMDESEKQVLGLKLGNIQNAPQIQSIAKKLEKKVNLIEKAVDQIKKVSEDQNEFIMDTARQITQDYLKPCAHEFQERIQRM